MGPSVCTKYRDGISGGKWINRVQSISRQISKDYCCWELFMNLCSLLRALKTTFSHLLWTIALDYAHIIFY